MLKAYLEDSRLGFLAGWRWIERRNPALAFPTDFGLVEVEEDRMGEIVRMMEGLELVKDVTKDTSFTRNAFANWEEVEVKKPGKLFTKMSFDERAENWSGGRAERRKLMLDVCCFHHSF